MIHKIFTAKKTALFSAIIAALVLASITDIACNNNGHPLDNDTSGVNTAQEITSPKESVLAWLNGWNLGSTRILLSQETESFLDAPSAIRKELYDEDFKENSYSITNVQLNLVSQNENLAEVLATYFIKITGSTNEALLETNNSWRFFLEKNSNKWLISSYE